MVIAQALGEYAGASAVAAAVSDAWLALRYHLSGVDSSTWAIVAVATVIVSYLWIRIR